MVGEAPAVGQHRRAQDSRAGARRERAPPRADAVGQRLGAARGQQREAQRRQGVQPSRHADALPAGQELIQPAIWIQPREAIELEAQRQHREREHGGAEEAAQAARQDRAAQPGDRQREDREAGKQRLFGYCVQPVAQRRGGGAPDAAVARGDEELIWRSGEAGDVRDRPPGLGVVAQRAHVRARQHACDEREAQQAGSGRQRDRSRRAGAPAPPPEDRDREAAAGDHVGQRQAEREAQRDQQGRDEPAGEDHAGPGVAVAADQQRERQRDRAAGDDVQVALLLEAVGRVRECRAGDERPCAPCAELTREQVSAEERQRKGEQEQHVVAHDRGARALADQARGGVADERVGDREAVAHRPEHVGLEEP